MQLFSIISFLYCIEIAQNTPLFQGFSVQKGFEVNFKPFQFKPLAIFKEKWSPFGRFGVRKGIQKRDLEASERISPRTISPAPVFEYFNEGSPADEKKDIIETLSNQLRLGPDLIKPLSSNSIRIPLSESFKPPTEGLYTSISRNPPTSVSSKPVTDEIFGELPPRPVGPISEPDIVQPQQVSVKPVSPIESVNILPLHPISQVSLRPVTPILLQPIESVSVPPVTPIPVQLNSPVPVRPLNPFSVQPTGSVIMRPKGFNIGQPQASVPPIIPLITPPASSNVPLSEIPPTDGPLVRGSKVALYFGNVLLQLVSQFLTNARMQFSQFSQQSSAPQVSPLPVRINT